MLNSKSNSKLNRISMLIILIIIGSFVLNSQEVKADGMNFTVNALLPENQMSEATYFDLLVIPKQEQDIQIELENSTDQFIDIEVTPRNAYTNDNGVISYDKDNIKLSNDAPLKFTDLVSGKQTVKLKPFEKTIASFNLKIPDIKYKGYVLGAFSIKEKEEHTGENKGQSVSISNKFSYTLGVKLSEERQNVVPQLSFTSVSPEIYLNKPSIVNTILNNTPEIAKNLDFDINIYKNNKIFYHTEEKGKSMAPYSYYNIHTSTQNKELKPGKYMVDMKVKGEGISFKTVKYFIVEKEQAKVINKKAIGLDKKPFNLLYIVVIIMILCILLVILFVLFIRKNKISKSKK